MGIEGENGARVRLVPVDRSLHLENALRWMNDPEVTARLDFHTGVTRAQEDAFFDRISGDLENEFHWAIEAEGFGHVGMISLHAIRWRHRCASGGLVIGEQQAWGRGIATDAVRVRTRFAFDQLGLHRVEGHTFHPAMSRVYLKNGYVPEGVDRQKIWRDGRWHDVARYAVLDADHFAARHGAVDVMT